MPSIFHIYIPSKRSVGTYRQVKFILSDDTTSLDLLYQYLPTPEDRPASPAPPLTPTKPKTEVAPLPTGPQSMPGAFTPASSSSSIPKILPPPAPTQREYEYYLDSESEPALLPQWADPKTPSRSTTPSAPSAPPRHPQNTTALPERPRNPLNLDTRPKREKNKIDYFDRRANLAVEPTSYKEAMDSLDCDKWA